MVQIEFPPYFLGTAVHEAQTALVWGSDWAADAENPSQIVPS
jgi:hypothetical protein